MFGVRVLSSSALGPHYNWVSILEVGVPISKMKYTTYVKVPAIWTLCIDQTDPTASLKVPETAQTAGCYTILGNY